MDPISLGLVLAAAFLHALWNLFAKGGRDKWAFMWALLASLSICYLPAFLWAWPGRISPRGWLFIGLTGILHAAYFQLLSTAYERGDLSVMYPLARGSGVALVPLIAVPILGERPSILGALGIALVVLGGFVLHLQPPLGRSLLRPFAGARAKGTPAAFAVGVTIALYSTVDKVGVSIVHPFIYIYLGLSLAALLTVPAAVRRRAAIREEWTHHRWQIVAAGILTLFTYLLVLFAMRRSPVSYIAAAREISVVFGALLGTWILGEPFARFRIPGACLIALGVACVGLAR